MAMVVNGVVVSVVDVIAVVGKFRTAVPKVVGKVEVVVVDAGVDDGHHHALSRVAQVPYLVGIHLGDI